MALALLQRFAKCLEGLFYIVVMKIIGSQVMTSVGPLRAEILMTKKDFYIDVRHTSLTGHSCEAGVCLSGHIAWPLKENKKCMHDLKF